MKRKMMYGRRTRWGQVNLPVQNLLVGTGSIINVLPTRSPFIVTKPSNKSDAAALRSDFVQVGNDFRFAMQHLNHGKQK